MRSIDRFLNKFIKRLDKIDQESLKTFVLNLKKENEFLYSVLQALPYGISIIDPHGIVTFSNSKAHDILMRPSTEKNVPLKRLFEDSDLFEPVSQYFNESKHFDDLVIDIIKPAIKTVLVSGIPLYDDTHVLYAYVVVIRDMQVDEEIEHTRRRDMFESLTTLAAGLAHEIGNPLNTIHIYLQLIGKELKSGSTKKVDEFIHVISSETRRLDKLVKNFLNVTRSKVSLIRKRSVNEPIRNAINFFKPELTKNSIACFVELDNDIPKFYIDSDRLYEAFANLIKNAIEAMPHGGDLRIISAMTNNIVTISVADTGIGIDPADLPHIFDAYYTKKQGGSGLGLMNVYAIIKAHKGRIHVDSEVNRGTTFRISLPIQREKLQLPLFTHN